jgi:CTP:molybdopterin cytidylyltransferase MocA
MSASERKTEPTAGIILAAGRSRRMGTPKALIHLGGRTLLDRLVETFLRAHVSPLVVVASGVTLELARSLEGIELVEGDSELPMIDSVARGLKRVENRAHWALVQPVDAPFTSVEMIAALRGGGGLLARALCHLGRPGHPILLPRSLYPEILERPEGGIRAILGRYDVELVEWPDAAPLADLDTPEDLEQWQSAHGGTLH